MSEQDEELKEAWRAFCEKLSDAGNSIIDSKTLGNDTDRVEGLRHLLRALIEALNFCESSDVDFLELAWFILSKQSGQSNGLYQIKR